MNTCLLSVRLNRRLRANFLYWIVRSAEFQTKLRRYIRGIIGGIGLEISRIEIPLPPIAAQESIIADVNRLQKVLDGARSVCDNYRPYVAWDSEWPLVSVGDVAELEYGLTTKAEDHGDARLIRITDISSSGFLNGGARKFVSWTDRARGSKLAYGDILVARTGATYGKTMMFDEDYPAVFASYLMRLRFPPDLVDPHFYWAFAQSARYWDQARTLMSGGAQPQFNGNALKQVRFPLAPLSVQHSIAADIKSEKLVLRANREMIERIESRVTDSLSRVWGNALP